jgi:hypothetical protein
MASSEFMGERDTSLYIEDFLAASPSRFFGVLDDTAACGGMSSVTKAKIEKVEFQKDPLNGVEAISVTASFGRRKTTNEERKACKDEGKLMVLPSTRIYHLDFVFDGHTYNASASSVAASRIFASPPN